MTTNSEYYLNLGLNNLNYNLDNLSILNKKKFTDINVPNIKKLDSQLKSSSDSSSENYSQNQSQTQSQTQSSSVLEEDDLTQYNEKGIKKNTNVKQFNPDIKNVAEIEYVSDFEDGVKIKEFNPDEIGDKVTCLKYMVYVIPFTEKVLQKNGILERILLIMDRIIRIIVYKQNEKSVDKLEIADAYDKLKITCNIIQKYFYKLLIDVIPNTIYTVLESTKYSNIVSILKKQHGIGFKIINLLLDRCEKEHNKENIDETYRYLRDYIYMYRALMSRENTIITNVMRKLLNPDEFVNLSYKFKTEIVKAYGRGWRKNILIEIINVEKTLSIDNLNNYTPILDPKAQEFLNSKHFVND